MGAGQINLPSEGNSDVRAPIFVTASNTKLKVLKERGFQRTLTQRSPNLLVS